MTYPKATIRCRWARVMSIKLHFIHALDSLRIVFHYSGGVMHPQHLSGSCIRYFGHICMSFVPCIWVIFSFFNCLLLNMNSTPARYCSN